MGVTMKKNGLLIIILFVSFLTGCKSVHRSAELSLINLTDTYMNSQSKEEKNKTVDLIEEAFVRLDKIGNSHFKVPYLPEEINQDLMKDLDVMGLGAKKPKFIAAYSCNGFHYIIGFTCLVKREIYSKKGSKKIEEQEKWTHDLSKDYLLFDGVPVKKYPACQIQ